MTAPTRRPLPMRRRSETMELKYAGLAKPHVITIGYYDDGTPGEVFIDGGKSGEQVEAIARDGAVLVSMCLQHGVSMETIRKALTRDVRGEAQSIVGAVIDKLSATERSA